MREEGEIRVVWRWKTESGEMVVVQEEVDGVVEKGVAEVALEMLGLEAEGDGVRVMKVVVLDQSQGRKGGVVSERGRLIICSCSGSCYSKRGQEFFVLTTNFEG